MKQQLLEIESLCKVYGKADNLTKALNGITFQVMTGEFLGIMGSSGSGKSTLLNCIATVIRPSGGRISMQGTDIHSPISIVEGKGHALQSIAVKKSDTCFRILNCWTILPGRKTFYCRFLCTIFQGKKAGNVCSHWRTIWKLQMCWINFRHRCPAASSSVLPQRGH